MTNLTQTKQPQHIFPVQMNRAMYDVTPHVFHVRDWIEGSNYAITIYAEEYLNVLDYGLSYCSKHDQFSRKDGRDRAKDRLSAANNTFSNVHVMNENSPSKTGSIVAARKFRGSLDVRNTILSHMLYSSRNIPSWAVRLITGELVNGLVADYNKNFAQ